MTASVLEKVLNFVNDEWPAIQMKIDAASSFLAIITSNKLSLHSVKFCWECA